MFVATRHWRYRCCLLALLHVGYCTAADNARASGEPAVAAAAAVSAPAPQGPLHVASPDWREQIVYFVMIDRFDDGDPRNSDQGQREYDPASGAHYSGGDLRGITRRLDYIRGLGATAVWITPPVAHQWWDDAVRYGGYHGYWGTDFMAVDPHFGSLADYQDLSRALHGAGMYLVQDIVVNHVGNFIRYPAAWDPRDPTVGFVSNSDRGGRRAPPQAPFDRNDPRDPAQRAQAIYHWTPTIRDGTDREQELTWQLADLDDLNTENPQVRAALRRSYGHWIAQVGVDAFRVDTAFYVPPAFFTDFLHADDAQAPGIARVAAATGRDDFLVFGEGFGIDPPFADAQARKIDAYLREADGTAMPGMINFPLYGSTLDVFARGRPTAALGHRLRSMMQLHARPHLMPSFVDNHDVDRFLAGGSATGLQQSLLLIMTLPGIPTIYYGTEQGFTRPRAAMFAGGYQSGGSDHFDTQAPLYRQIASMAALRRGNRVFTHGTPTVLFESAAGPGGFAYRMRHATTDAVVVFNSADRAALLDNLDTGLPAGTTLRGVFDLAGATGDLVVGAGGKLDLSLPPRAGRVWIADRSTANTRDADARATRLTLNPTPTKPVRGDLSVSGHAIGTDRIQLVIDGDLERAIDATADADGRWSARIDTANMVDPAIEHRLVAWSAGPPAASAARQFRVAREWQLLAQADDPNGDDHGPSGRYRYPSDPSWGENRQMDLLGARLSGSGGALRIEVPMHRITSSWNPANGFDHVAFSIFIGFPDRAGGATVMPRQNASLPQDKRWHYRLRAHGWSNALFSADGASATADGTSVVPAADIQVDAKKHTITFTVPAASLGDPPSLDGAIVYLTTWDYDGGYRALGSDPRSYGFTGGAATDPLVMDDLLLRIPARDGPSGIKPRVDDN
jgi:glycosidase